MQRLHPEDWRTRRRRDEPYKATKGVGKRRRHQPYPRRWTDVYVLAVGNGGQVDDWGRYLREMTSRPGWNVARLARDSGINRSTIHEWMRWGGKSLTVASVLAVAKGLDVDPEEALLAAGNVLYRAGHVPADEPEIAEILVSGLPEDVQQALIEAVIDERKRDQQNRLTNVRRMIRLAGGEAAG
jgi:transposase-like protein